MSAETATGTCPECGAANPVTATRCWMCGRTAWAVGTPPASSPGLPSAAPASEEVWIADDQETPRPGMRDTQKNRWLILGTAALVIAGVGWEAPGLATLLAIVVGFPLLITLGTAAVRESRFHRQRALGHESPAPGKVQRGAPARPMSGGEQVSLFFKWMAFAAGSVLVTAALLVILVAVMVISLVTALLEACGILFHTAQGG